MIRKSIVVVIAIAFAMNVCFGGLSPARGQDIGHKGEKVEKREAPAPEQKKSIIPLVLGIIGAAVAGWAIAEELNKSEDKAKKAEKKADDALAKAEAAAAAAAAPAPAPAPAEEPKPAFPWAMSIAGSYEADEAVATADCGTVTPEITFAPLNGEFKGGSVLSYVATEGASNECGKVVNSGGPYTQVKPGSVFLFVNDGTYHGQCDIKSDGGALSINGKRFHSTGGSAKLIEKP